MNRPCCTLVLAVCIIAQGALAGDCTQKFWTWAVDKTSARALQQFVNDGHEPWRMDDVVTVAQQAIAIRKAEWGDTNTVIGAPKVLSETGGEAVLVANSKDGEIRYVVTLRKYGWLLKQAQNRWSLVVWIPASVERTDCASQNR